MVKATDQDERGLALGQKDGAERPGRRVDIEAGRTRRQQAPIRGLGDEADSGAVGAGGIEDREGKANAGEPLKNGGKPRQAIGFERLDHHRVRGIRSLAALGPARERALEVEIERDHLFAGTRRRHRERRCKCGFSRSAFLGKECDRVHCKSLVGLAHDGLIEQVC